MGPLSQEMLKNNCSSASRLDYNCQANAQETDLSWWENLSEQDIQQELYGSQFEGCAA